MNLDLKIRNQLRKIYDKQWQEMLSKAKSIVEKQDIQINSQDEIKATFVEWEYDEKNTYRYWWKILFPIAKQNDFNTTTFIKTLNESLDPRPKIVRGLYEEFIYSFSDGYFSTTGYTLYFKMHPDENEVTNLANKIKKEVLEKEQEQKSIQYGKEILKQEELTKITKPEALKKAKEDLINSVSFYHKIQKKNYEELINDKGYEKDIYPIVESIALKWGLNPKELEEYSFKETKILNDDKFVYCHIHGKIKEEKIDQKELIKSCPKCLTILVTEKEYKSYLNKEKFKDVIVDTTLQRLPRFIYKVVKDTKVLFKDKTRSQTEGGHYAPMSGSITVRWNRDWHDLNNYMGTLAHEYWHVFERKSGFKSNLKDVFQETIEKVALGNLGQNTIEDFIIVIQTLSYFGKEDFSEILKMISGRWGKDYFKKQHTGKLIEDLQKIQHSIDDSDLYKTINELLAETLADIVTQKQSKKIPQSLIVWMNKKFSSKNQFIKNSEKIVEEFLKTSSHLNSLLEDLEKLINNLKDVPHSEKTKNKFLSWYDQIKKNKIKDKDLISWIENQIDYWSPKDRNYSNFLETLIEGIEK
jgi:hypothetical protein